MGEPNQCDDVLDVVFEMKPETQKEEMTMSLDPSVASLMTQQLTQSGVIAQNNFVTVQKVVDYDYLENKRMVTLDEAVGIREVQSQKNPAGPAVG